MFTLGKEASTTVSETLMSPKFIDNRKYAKKAPASTSVDEVAESEGIIKYIKEDKFIKSATFLKDGYHTVNYVDQMMKDIERFCVFGKGILTIDSTFELCDGLWLTDTTYTNLSLVVAGTDRNPAFPGPSFWYFRKSRADFRRFAGELLIARPILADIRKIGHDFDKAQAGGNRDIFKSSSHLWCTQHIKGRDAEQLRKLCCSEKDRRGILSDIYGTQNDLLLQNGLADAEDALDFQVKLCSLKEPWEEIAPGFYDYFVKNHSKNFLDCLALSARKELGIEGRYYSNGLELKHKLQKKKLREAEIPKEVTRVSETLLAWANDNYYLEATKALRGFGKYRLAKEYRDFERAPEVWIKYS